MVQARSISYRCEHCDHVNEFDSVYFLNEIEIVSEALIDNCVACKKSFIADLFEGDVA